MKSQTAAVYQALRTDLLACRIHPGRRIRVNEVCEQMGVSAGAVREALSRLTSEGLVVSEPQRGFTAAPISINELQDLTEVRCEIEALCLRRAFAAGDVVWESALVAAQHRLSRTPIHPQGEPPLVSDEWAAVHTEFHEVLVSACDSPTLLTIRRGLYFQAERYRRLSVPLSQSGRDLTREHQEMVAAVLRRDVEAAVELTTSHIRETTRWVVAAASGDLAARLVAIS